jgi:predicted amidohydrolase
MGVTDDKATNLAKIEQYMTEAAAQGAKLIVFPETVVLPNPGIGYASQLPSEEVMAAFESAAETIPGETTDWLTQKASYYGMYIILGMIERDSEGKFFNASVFLGPQGWLATYRKRGLYDQMYGGNENLFYTRGEKAGIVVDSPLGKIGLTITNEILTYGPNFRKDEADLVVSVSSYPNMPDYPFEEWTAKLAQQCGCWHVAANLLGPVGYTESIGHSQIINPQGEVLADTGSAEGMVIVETGVMVDEASIPTTSQP